MCLDDETVLGLVEGRLAAPALAAVDDHLDDCPSCRDVVAQLARTRTTASVLPSGHALGRYIVGELLGEGAMGRVYAAWQPELDRRVAIKVLHDDAPRGRERLVREAQAMARLDHPNVVGVHEVGTTDDGVYVAMDLVDGETLRAWAEVPRPWRDVARVLVDIARGLHAVHETGVVHRDVKPDNIIVGSDGRARLGDFGLARGHASVRADLTAPDATAASADTLVHTTRKEGRGGSRTGTRPTAAADTFAQATRKDGPGASHTAARATAIDGTPANGTSEDRGASGRAATRATAIAGTPAYMAPEVLRGASATAASDQFSFGVTAYEILAGNRPFAATTWSELVVAIERGSIAPLRGAPAWLDAAIRRCLATDPARRFSSLAAVADHLAERTQHRRPIVWIGAIAAAAVAASAITLVATRDRAAAVETCELGAGEIAATWSPIVRARLAAMPRAQAAVDEWTARWTLERNATCRAAREQSAQLVGARERCLELRRAELDGMLARLSARPSADGDASRTAIDGDRLPAPTRRAGDASRTTTDGDTLRAPTRAVDHPSGTIEQRRDGAPPSTRADDERRTSVGATDARLHAGDAGGDPALAPVAPLAGTAEARLVDALAALQPSDCAVLPPDMADPLPLDPERAAAVRAVDAKLPAIRAAIALGDGRAVVTDAATVVATARTSGHAPTLAEATLAHAEALQAAEAFDAALAATRDAIGAAERGRADVLVARGWVLWLALATARRDLAGAEQIVTIVSAVIERAGTPPRLAAEWQRLRAAIAYNRGDLADARVRLEDVRRKLAIIAGERSIDVALAESALGVVARAAGDLDAAEQHLRAAYAIDRALRGDRHPDLARDLHNIAGVLRLRGDLVRAQATYEEALAIDVATHGERSAAAGLTHNSLGLVKLARNDLAGARAEFESARDMLAAAGHGDRGFAEHNLGITAAAAGDHRAALVHFAAARAVYATTIGDAAAPAVRLVLDTARSLAAVRDPTARTQAQAALTIAERANIAWLADDARALLAPLRGATPPTPGTPRPPRPPLPSQPPQPKRDVGVYGPRQP